MQQRVGAPNLAVGILILWIMGVHTINGSKIFGEVDARVALPYPTFSMPWFFYRSGQFYKPLSWNDRIRNDVHKLLVPFLKWSAIGYTIWLAMQFADGTFTWEQCILYPLQTFYLYGYIPVNVPMWFVLSLFFVRIFSERLLQWSVPPALCLIAGVGIGFGLHLLNSPSVPFYVPNIAMGIAFFMLGRLMGKYENKSWLFAWQATYCFWLPVAPLSDITVTSSSPGITCCGSCLPVAESSHSTTYADGQTEFY